MTIEETTTLTAEQKVALLGIWNAEYPAAVSYSSPSAFESYFTSIAEKQHLLLIGDDGVIHGWASRFLRDGEEWFAILLGSGAQRKGYGSLLLGRLKQSADTLAGWVADHDDHLKADGSVYRSPLAFYTRNGFAVIPDKRLETGVLSLVKIEWKRLQ